MKLTLKVLETDYTDNIESIRLEQHAEGILQAALPSVVMVIRLSTVVPDTVKPPNNVVWGVGNKSLTTYIQKITRTKHGTEIRTAPRPVKAFDQFIPGLFTPSSEWRQLFSTGSLQVDDNLIDYGQQTYINSEEQALLGLVHTAKQQSMVENTVPAPWASKSDYIGLTYQTIRQLQTVAEFNASQKPNVAKYQIDYEDVVSEEDYNSQVDPNIIVTSKLGQKKPGASYTYTSTTDWANALQEVKLHECATGNCYGVSILTGSGTSAKSTLYMSDGSVYSVSGYILGVTPEAYYVYVPSSSTKGTISIIRFSDGAIISDTPIVNFPYPLTHRILENLSTHDEAVRLRQTLRDTTYPCDIILMGRPQALSTTGILLGFSRFTEVSGITGLAVVTSTTPELVTALKDSWLLGTYASTDRMTATYGKQGTIVRLQVRYDGAIFSGYQIYSGSNDVTVYPVSAAPTSTYLRLTGYSTSSPNYRYGEPQASPMVTPPIQWRSISGDSAYMGWVTGFSDTIVKKQGTDFAWRTLKSKVEYANSTINGRSVQMKYIISQTVSVLIFGGGASGEQRTLVIESSPLPQNTYDLHTIETPTGNSGEYSKLHLPFLLQGGNQSWALIPTDKTRLKIQVSALRVATVRSNSITLAPGVEASASGSIYYTHNNRPQPGHKYYIALEVLAPQGIQATKASYAWGSEEYSSPTPTVVLSLNNLSASSQWRKVSSIAAVPADYTPESTPGPGVYSENATNSWSFRHPTLVDLTETFGAGNEPTKEWCDSNLEYTDYTMLSNNSLDSQISSYKWSLSNASFDTELKDEKFKIDNDDFIIPQIGCPILYQREDGGEYEEGIILGFDQQFEGNTELYVDVLLLGQPKPWSNSRLTQ